MINIDFTNIDNAKLIGRLLPFWARGRRVSLLLQALISPLASAHSSFKSWALEKYIECHITAQKSSLEWFLKHKLQRHFKNENDGFSVISGLNDSESCFSGDVWRNGLYWDNDLQWGRQREWIPNLNMNLSCINTGQWENDMFWSNDMMWVNESNGIKYDDDFAGVLGQTNVYAPAIVDTISYDHEDYERDIRNILSKFMINFNKINIIIAEN